MSLKKHTKGTAELRRLTVALMQSCNDAHDASDRYKQEVRDISKVYWRAKGQGLKEILDAIDKRFDCSTCEGA